MLGTGVGEPHKAETVEELRARRKKLHMGMCELLRADLARQADANIAKLSRSSVAVAGLKERALKDFDDQTREHEEKGDKVFNQDENYKVLSNEAIDGKAYALQKMDIYLQMADVMSQQLKDTILNAPLKDFAGLMRLSTDFPFDDVKKTRRQKSTSARGTPASFQSGPSASSWLASCAPTQPYAP